MQKLHDARSLFAVIDIETQGGYRHCNSSNSALDGRCRKCPVYSLFTGDIAYAGRNCVRVLLALHRSGTNLVSNLVALCGHRVRNSTSHK
jgi:hypothetical protein